MTLEITKTEFIMEIQNRGEIDVSKIDIGYKVVNKWFKMKEGMPTTYTEPSRYTISISNLAIRNPPTDEADISFMKYPISMPSSIDKAWALARINELPFTAAPPTPASASITFDSSPKNATVHVDGVLIGNT